MSSGYSIGIESKTPRDPLPPIIGRRDAAPERACDSVARQLQGLIVEGRLPSGSQLPPERDLAVQFQTSRATISQALRILSTLGLVDIQHGSGVYVSPEPGRLLKHSIELLIGVDRHSMVQLVEARGWMEIAAVERAAEVAEEPHIRAIESAYEQLAQERDSIERWLRIDIEFHRAVLLATGNRFVLTIVSPVLELMADARTHAYQSAGHDPAWFASGELDRLIDLHGEIATAISTHDPPAARRHAEVHQLLLTEHVATIDPSLA